MPYIPISELMQERKETSDVKETSNPKKGKYVSMHTEKAVQPIETEKVTGERTKPLFEFIDPSTSYTHAIGETIQEAGAAGGKFLNALSLGLPEYVLKKFGYHLPETPSKAGKVLSGAAELGGFITGPAKIAGKLVGKIPVITRAFTPAKNMTQAILKPVLRSATTLGIAQGSMTPEEGGFLNPKARALQFKRGVQMGAMFGGISFVPTKVLRMLVSSVAIGIPSTLSNQPLEQQVFDYGLGAFFGIKGGSPKEVLTRERAVIKRIKYGTDKAQKFLDDNACLLKEEITMASEAGVEPMSKEARFKKIISSGNTSSLLSLANDILLNKVRTRASEGKSRIVKGKDGKPMKLGTRQIEKAKAQRLKKADETWKTDMSKDIIKRVLELKKDSKFQLEMGEMDFIVEHLTKNIGLQISKVSKMDRVQLTTLKTMLENYRPEISTPFRKPPPLKAMFADGNWSKKISPWDATLRGGLAKIEKLGFGSITQRGLTNELFDSGTDKAQFRNRYMGLRTNWQSILGMNKTRANDVFECLDGKVHREYIRKIHGEKTLKVIDQMRVYLDTLLKHQNRIRATYGEEPIKAQKNYITHIFENLVKEIQVKKYPMPDWLLEVMPYITPQKASSKFLKTRKGGKGFQKDVFKALDAYTYSASSIISDLPIRRAYKIDRFLKKQIEFERKQGKVSKIDWSGIRKNLKIYINGLQGKPGSMDSALRGMVDPINNVLKYVPGQPQIKSLNDMTDGMISLLYGTQMAFRPKLPLRNLGQHSLVIGQTGFKPLGWAITVKRTPEILRVLGKSKVLASRAKAFGPESQALFSHGTLQKITEIGMRPFKAADIKNVVDAYLAGYKQAKNNPKKFPDPYKRGDAVAAITQFIYLPENRSDLARGFGLSKSGGRLASVFTTWPANWVEFNIASAKNPDTRMNLLKYWAFSLAFSGVTAAIGIKGSAYTGISSPAALLNILRGKLPIVGVAERPGFQALREFQAWINGDKDLKNIFLYTYR